jgi:hypothetical protein
MKIRILALLVLVCLAAVTGGRSVSAAMPVMWQSMDVGKVGQPGSASEMSGTFTVSGAGADIWGTADAFHFAYRPLNGDGSIVAQVSSLQGAHAWTKVGVMMRASTQANAAHALMLVSRSSGLAFQRRTAAGGSSVTTSGGAGTAPKWVRLTRAGSKITGSVSADGISWTTVASDTVALPYTAQVGLAVTSHDATRLATGTFDSVKVSKPSSTSTPGKPWAKGRLEVAPNLRMLRHATTGTPFFYLADTAWGALRRLNRAEADVYLQDAVAKGFNAVQVVALWNWETINPGAKNAYGDHPLVVVDGRYDPARVVTTTGNNPADPAAYDYWDHIDYVIDKAEQYGLYVTLQPTWGNYVSGTNSFALDMSSNIFTVANARVYGEFIGRRYGSRPNIIWMLGGDRAAIYPNGDFTPVWRSLAEGIGRGITGQALVWNQPHAAWNQFLMTYHATRRNDPGSSLWFHHDAWLDFNSVQSEYHSITKKVATDWAKLPTKPTVVIETRYEDESSTDHIVFTGAFKQRYQMYHSVLAGSLGYVYGHGRIWDFKTKDKTWQMALNDPGRLSIKTVWQLLGRFSDSELMNRVPDQTLLDGSLGSGATEDLLVAMRGGDRRFAIVYSTNGRDIRLKAAQLATGAGDAYWFSPRNGRYYNSAGAEVAGRFASIATGTGAPLAIFNPPGTAGSDNDWILIVRVR